MGTRVYVGRISYDVRERDIEKFFKGYGRIREILMKDGFAFVVSCGKEKMVDCIMGSIDFIFIFHFRNLMITGMQMMQCTN